MDYIAICKIKLKNLHFNQLPKINAYLKTECTRPHRKRISTRYPKFRNKQEHLKRKKKPWKSDSHETTTRKSFTQE